MWGVSRGKENAGQPVAEDKRRAKLVEHTQVQSKMNSKNQRHTFSFPHPERPSSYSACRSYKGSCKPGRATKRHHQHEHPSCYCNILNTLKMLTFPRFAILFVSFLLMCLSMLVSPRDIRTACQRVSAPRATPTVLQIMIVKSTINKGQSGLS